MADYTENLNLILPKKSESYDIETANTNNKIIDTEINKRVEKIEGKSLSENDFTNAYKKILDAIANYDSQYAPSQNIEIEIAGLKANKANVEDVEAHTTNSNIHLSDVDRTILTKANKFKGYFENDTTLKAAFSTAEAGDYAIVNSTDTMWIYDADTNEWKDSDQKGQVISVNNMTGEVVIGIVTETKEGLMSATDKSNLEKLLEEIVTNRATVTLNSTISANMNYAIPLSYKVR